MLVFFFAASKNKDNAKVALAPSSTLLEISGFNLMRGNIVCSKITQLFSYLATLDELQASRGAQMTNFWQSFIIYNLIWVLEENSGDI